MLGDGRWNSSTHTKTVQVSGATYWAMIYDDMTPTPLSAGLILAKYDELVRWLLHMASLEMMPTRQTEKQVQSEQTQETRESET